MAVNININITGKNNLGKALRDAKGDIAGLERAADRSSKGIGKLGTAAAVAAGTIVAELGVKAAGAFTKFMQSTIGMAADFEQQINILGVSAGANAAELDKFREVALKVGESTDLIGITASGAAGSITDFIKAGLKQEVILGDINQLLEEGVLDTGALRSAIDLAAASELDLAGSTDILAVALATFGGELETVEEQTQFAAKASDILVRAADASVASAGSLGAAWKNLGPVWAQLGFSFEEGNQALAMMSTRGIEGVEAGTALKRMLQSMTRDVDKVHETYDELGISLFDSAGNMKDMRTIIGELRAATADLTQEEQHRIGMILAGSDGIRAYNTLIAGGQEAWDGMGTAMAEAAGVQEQAEARTKGYAAALEAFEGVIESLKIRIGTEFLPILTEMVQNLSQFVETNMPRIVSGFETLAGFIQQVSGALSSGDFAQFQKIVGEGLASLFDQVDFAALEASLTTTFAGMFERIDWGKAGASVAKMISAAFNTEMFRLDPSEMNEGGQSFLTKLGEAFRAFDAEFTRVVDEEIIIPLAEELEAMMPTLVEKFETFKAETIKKFEELRDRVIGPDALIPKFLADVLTEVGTWKTNMVKRFGELKTETGIKIEEMITGVLTKLHESKQKVFDKGKEVGDSIMRGIGQGIDDAKKWLQGKAEAIAGWLPGWVKRRLGIASPSSVFAEIGRESMRGLGEGIIENAHIPLQALNSMVNQAMVGMQPMMQLGAGLPPMMTGGMRGVGSGGFMPLGAGLPPMMGGSSNTFNVNINSNAPVSTIRSDINLLQTMARAPSL